MQLMVNFGIFPLPSTGTYNVEMFLDDRVYRDQVYVSLSDKPIV